MPNPKTTYVCQQCGFTSPRWLGKCPECNMWNSFVENIVSSSPHKKSSLKTDKTATPLTEIETTQIYRTPTNFKEFDRVLGGGIVPGSVMLVGGEPGIGKSTLLLQIVANLPEKTIYLSAEESLQQLKLRADRLGISTPNLAFLASTYIEEIIAVLENSHCNLIIVDSIQTVYSENLQGAPGSIGQVRECAQQLTQFAKTHNIPIFIIGHITKEGTIAGPKTLEHLVDAVFYLEGEENNQFRILRSVKNRFGAIDEVGIFRMQDKGLIEVPNPSEVFLSQNTIPTPGSAVVATLEGTRPVLVELQALTTRTLFGYPRRTASGIDINRLYLLTAVLGRHAGISLDNQDIYINITGGLKIKEPAIDLGIALALYSSYKNKPLSEKTAVFGEIGLSGEIRPVNNMQQRLQEIDRLGFKKVIMPKTNIEKTKLQCTVNQAKTLSEALEIIR